MKILKHFRAILMLSLVFFTMLSCSKAEPVLDEQLIEEAGLESNSGEGTVIIDNVSYNLHYGELEDWGLEYPGSRQYSIDLYSENYEVTAPMGIKMGIYLNSPSLTNFTTGTYGFEEEETTPGAIMFGNLSINLVGYHFIEGNINVQKEESNYIINWEMKGKDVESGEIKDISGNFVGPLNFWSVDF